jgi:glucose-1-phosphate cytidylyltransferase
MLTYGDGLSNINISRLLKFHKKHKKIATVSGVHPIARFGELNIKGTKVKNFKEKPQINKGWINGGFFVFEPKIFKFLNNDKTILEGKPLEKLAKNGELMAYLHDGFWYCMDTPRDKDSLEEMWRKKNAPWKKW